MLEREAPGGGHGFFPLDNELGLTSDRFGLNMFAVVVRLATTLSFATAKSTAELFLPDVPATEVIEQATLGFGRFTSKWFESAPAPDDDGDVLVILFDGKGTPPTSFWAGCGCWPTIWSRVCAGVICARSIPS